MKENKKSIVKENRFKTPKDAFYSNQLEDIDQNKQEVSLENIFKNNINNVNNIHNINNINTKNTKNILNNNPVKNVKYFNKVNKNQIINEKSDKLVLKDKSDAFFEEIIEFVKEKKPSKDELAKYKVLMCKKHSAKKIPTDIEILLRANNEDLVFLRKYLTTKPVRTGSGVAVIAIMTAPFRCPHGKCTYCPGGPNSYFGDVPQSYTGHEPASMRGIRNNYDAYLQVMNRLEQYVAIGQNPDKVELIIMGGTFPSYAKEYQEEFVRDAFSAMNDFSKTFYNYEGDGLGDLNIDKFKKFFLLPGNLGNKERTKTIQKKLLKLKEANKKSLIDSQKINETAKIRCIGLTIETKPDWGLLQHGNEMLKLGCTRVELGIQTLNDRVLKETHRGHTLEDTKRCIQELKDLGFKLNFHMMPGLPGVNKKQDIACYEELFANPAYRPDMLKIYPTMVMPGTKLFVDYKAGKYHPLTTDQAAEVISEAVKFVPKYCRIMRVQRDIPTKFSEGGVQKNNLRQLVEYKIAKKGFELKDIRHREIGRKKIVLPESFEIIEYDASNAKEYFISLVDSADQLLGFARLRIVGKNLREEFKDKTSIIRELHVYGTAIPVGADGFLEEKTQHKGYGKRLMEKAQEIAVSNGVKKMLVISGVGVKEYYKKIGYDYDGPYMSKLL